MTDSQPDQSGDGPLVDVATELRQDVHDLGNSLAHIKLGISLLNEALEPDGKHARAVAAIHEAIDDADSIYRLMLTRLT